MKTMKNLKKLERLKSFLDGQGMEYRVQDVCDKPGYYNLYIPQYRIAVKVTNEGEEDDRVFFEYFKRLFYPVFVRTSDTPKFVIEKVQNTIIKSMLRSQKNLLDRVERENKGKQEK